MPRVAVQKKAQEFEEKVRTFLKELGFIDVNGGPNFSLGGVQVDACGGVEDTLLIIECTIQGEQKVKPLLNTIRRFRGVFNRIRQAIKDHPDYGKYSEIKFVIATNFDPRQSDKEECTKEQPPIYVWDKDFIEYYADLKNKIGEYARYNLLGELGVKPKLKEQLRYPAIETELGSYVVYTFFAPPKQLLRLSYVARREIGNEKYYQRLVITSRLTSIGKFLDRGGIFPNSVIVAFNNPPDFIPLKDSEANSDWPKDLRFGLLSFPNDYRACWIVDGQHRLYGCTKSSSETRIPVIAFKSLSAEEQAKFFLEINRNQKPVPSDLVWDLEGELRPEAEDGIISRIAKDLNRRPPLEGKIYIPLKGPKKRGQLKLSGICMAIKRRKLVREYTEHPQGRANPLYAEDPDKRVQKVADALSKYLLAVDAKFEPWVKSGFLFQNSGMAVLISLFERFITRYGRELTEQELDSYLNALVKHLQKYRAEDDLRKLRLRCNSEGGRDEVTAEFIRAIRQETGDQQLATDVPTWTYEGRLKALERAIADHIQSVLHRQNPQWLKERVPEEIRKKALEIMRRKGGTKPWDFFTFGECGQIMKRNDNWPFFQNFWIGGEFGFSDEEQFWAAFNFLKRARDDFAHGRPVKLRYQDDRLLDAYLAKFERCLRINTLVEQPGSSYLEAVT